LGSIRLRISRRRERSLGCEGQVVEVGERKWMGELSLTGWRRDTSASYRKFI
jgi:hypothetical protein